MNERATAAQAAERLRRLSDKRRDLVHRLEDEGRDDMIMAETADGLRHEHDAMLLGAKALMYLVRQRAVGKFPVRLSDTEQMEPEAGEVTSSPAAASPAPAPDRHPTENAVPSSPAREDERS